MKYSEFKREVEKMGYWVDIDNAHLYVDKSERGETIIAIGKHRRFSVDTSWNGFHAIPEENQIAIYNLAHALTVTPLAEREEEKRHWLRKIPVPLLKESDDLWYYEPINKLFKPGVDRDRTDNEKYKSIFTESEISQMDITGFEKIEVTE